MMYRAESGKLPANIKNDAGEDLLSWRVAMLPFLESDFDHSEINKDEAWNSENNQQFAEFMPQFFDAADAGVFDVTTWKMPDGSPAEMLFIAGGRGSEVPWMKPDVCTLDAADVSASLAEEPEGGYVVVH